MGLARFFGSTIGQKAIVALTGVVLVGFVLGHMAGNLQIFIGPDAINQYGVSLRKIPALLWAVRLGLLLCAVLHVTFTIRLKLAARRARPMDYAKDAPVASTLFSRTMILTGLLVLAYAAYHLMHFTWHATNPEFAGFHDAQGRHDVYRMLVTGFQQAPISIIYIFANVLLGFHLAHGFSSLFQTLGVSSPRHKARLELVGRAVALIATVGFVSVPVAVLLGIVS